ncbi:MAG: PRC-barrel domain-containing protein [Verrucomicrobiota bacterium]
MFRSTKQMKGHALRARDGDIGEVKDFYFDDRQWQIRYLVVETGAWLQSRRVLLSPAAVGGMDGSLKTFPVDLTMEQVRNSPGIDTDKPVSRQHEEELHAYYGWPAYWAPTLGIGDLGVPLMPPPAPEPPTEGNAPLRRTGDPHLRSANHTTGYTIEATDGSIGHVDDYLIDDDGWRIRYLVIDTRNWWPGKKVLVAPGWIRDVSWESHSVHLDINRDAVKASPAYEGSEQWTSAYAAQLHDHYARPRYSDWDKDVTAGAPRLQPTSRDPKDVIPPVIPLT